MSIKWKLSLILLVFSLTVAAVCGTGYIGLETLSVARAFVAGEGLYSKAQRDAIRTLEKYALLHDPNDYDQFFNYLKVEEGDLIARIEIEKENPNFDVLDRGLIQGGNHPSEVRDMAIQFRRFRRFKFVDQAFQAWLAGDRNTDELKMIARKIHQQLQTGPLSLQDTRQYFSQIEELNRKFTQDEENFSSSVGKGARWMKGALVWVIVSLAGISLALGLWISLRLSRKILDGIDLLSLGTARIEKGDFSNPIPVQSQDELGKLAVSFNHMATSLRKTLQERNVARDDLEHRARQLSDAQAVARLGSWEWEIIADRVQWSDELFRILGLNPETTTPSYKEFMSRVHPDDQEKMTAAVNESVEHGTPFNCHFQCIRGSDSEIRELHSQGKVMEDSSGVRRIVGTLQDITEQRRMHSQLMQAGKMASLGEMAGGIAHEINSPLAIIKGTCAMMEELVTTEKVDRVLLKRMMNNIESTTDRIAKIVKGLRVFSRDGSSEPFEKVTVRQLMENTLILCKTRFKSQMIELICDEYSPTLSFDGRMIELSQVLLNLLNNASDAIEREPKKWIRISFQELGQLLEIRVIDCGKGIPEHHRKNLFQPFFTTKDFGKGTGLGLSVSMKIIKSHRGELKIDPSNPNTCFVIRIPLQQRNSSHPSPSAA